MLGSVCYVELPSGKDGSDDHATGVTHLSWLNTEVFRECYKDGHPYDDFVKITFRNCQVVCSQHLRCRGI